MATTTVFLKPIPGSGADNALKAFLRTRQARDDSYDQDVANRVFTYDPATGLWTDTSKGLLLKVPADLIGYLEDNPGYFTIVSVTLVKDAGIVGPKAAFQGHYVGTGKFEGCTATVDNYDGAQNITVCGPPHAYGKYYAGICTQIILPTIWLEPPPLWPVSLLRTLRLIRW